jgi:hypothetical protein
VIGHGVKSVLTYISSATGKQEKLTVKRDFFDPLVDIVAESDGHERELHHILPLLSPTFMSPHSPL